MLQQLEISGLKLEQLGNKSRSRWKKRLGWEKAVTTKPITNQMSICLEIFYTQSSNT